MGSTNIIMIGIQGHNQASKQRVGPQTQTLKTLGLYYSTFVQCALCAGMHYVHLMMRNTCRPSRGPPGSPGPAEEAD